MPNVAKGSWASEEDRLESENLTFVPSTALYLLWPWTSCWKPSEALFLFTNWAKLCDTPGYPLRAQCFTLSTSGVFLENALSLEPSLEMASAEENFRLVKSLPPSRAASNNDSSLWWCKGRAFSPQWVTVLKSQCGPELSVGLRETFVGTSQSPSTSTHPASFSSLAQVLIMRGLLNKGLAC